MAIILMNQLVVVLLMTSLSENLHQYQAQMLIYILKVGIREILLMLLKYNSGIMVRFDGMM
jgi:hypothetical protein